MHGFAGGAVSGALFCELCLPELMNGLICKVLMCALLALPGWCLPAQHLVNSCTQVLVGPSPQGTSALQLQLLHPPVPLQGGSSRVPA